MLNAIAPSGRTFEVSREEAAILTRSFDWVIDPASLGIDTSQDGWLERYDEAIAALPEVVLP